MSKTYDYNDLRKHSACVQRGHEFRPDGERQWSCKCNARAWVTPNGLLKINHGRPKSREEKQAEGQARKEKYLGT